MKGNNNNKFKIKTNMVQMPGGIFIFGILSSFFMGYEFCKSERRRHLAAQLTKALEKEGYVIFDGEGEYVSESGSDEE